MASTQSTLNDFFKCKRSTRLDIKNGNKTNVISHAPNESEQVSSQKIEELPVVATIQRCERKKQPVRRTKVSINSKQSNKGTNSTSDIVAAFQKAQKNKSKTQQAEADTNKKRQREEDVEVSHTPVINKKVINELASIPEEADEAKEDESQQQENKRHCASLNSTTKPANKEEESPKNSAAALREKLSKCNKLSELRAQLLNVKQCEKKLTEFRATVRQAQLEKEQALAVCMPGGSPRKAGFSPHKSCSSPLKAPSSPRKLFSPHRLASSPYVPPPSPRGKLPHPQLEHFSSLQLDVPVSPVKTPTKTPPASPLARRTAPAYQRYHHLISDGSQAETVPSELTLPYKYRLVREMFRGVDTVVSLLHNRHEAITFSKLKAAVQQMLRKTFTENNLGQLKTVFPLAYFFKQEKVKATSSSNSGYQLTVTANLNYKSQESVSTAKVNLMSRLNDSTTVSNSAPTFRKMDSLVLVERRSIFHAALIKIIQKHHADFLKTLEPSVVIPDNKTIKRWHPNFDLDKVPEIEAAPLPQPPTSQAISSATEVLATARNLFSLNSHMEAAVERAAEAETKRKEELKTKVEQVDKSSVQKAAVQSKDLSLALRGISASLLQKVRAREAEAACKVMVRSPAENKALAQLSALPDMVRILKHTYTAEKKAALSWDAVLATLRESHTGMLGPSELEEHLELLLKELPSWITRHKLSSGVFVKINKKTDVNTIVSELNGRIKQRS